MKGRDFRPAPARGTGPSVTIAEGTVPAPVVPWRSGQVNLTDVPPLLTPATGNLIGPGTWAMRPDATVPFVSFQMTIGTRVVTWGEVVEIPVGKTATLGNASYHSGDIRVASVHAGQVGARPAVVTLPALVKLVGTGIDQAYLTREVDTRLVRRAYLMSNDLNFTAQGITYNVLQRGRDRGLQFPAGTGAATSGSGALSFVKTLPVSDIKYLDLGNGTGTYLDPAGKPAPDNTPHALLDSVQVKVAKVTGDPVGFDTTSNLVFVLEYH